MKNIKNIKQKLGANTEKIEKQVGEYYLALEPWQRGTLMIGLTVLLILLIYWLTKEDTSELKRAKREAQLEEKLLKQMILLKRLKE